MSNPTITDDEAAIMDTVFKSILWRLKLGCGNHGCVVRKPVGMGTNGPCTCRRNTIIADLKRILRDLEFNQ